MNEQLKFDNLEGANEILQFSDFVAQEQNCVTTDLLGIDQSPDQNSYFKNYVDATRGFEHK